MHSGNINNLFMLLFSRSTKFIVFWAKYHWIKFAQKIVSKSFKFIKICIQNCFWKIIRKNFLVLLLSRHRKLYQNHSNFHFSAQRGPRRAEPARSGLPRAHRPHPGRNLGLGRQSAARARSRLGLDLAQRISSVRLDPTAERPFRAVKTTAAAGALENPSAFVPSLSLSSSPLSLISLQP